MHDRGANHLLQQIPLTVSPHLQLPTAVTLPYSYQSLPLGLPQPSTDGGPGGGGYITSPSGSVSNTPDEIIRACHSLLQHLSAQKAAAEQAVRDWEQSIEDRELMEKRRVAPGYLDTGVMMLEPTRRHQPQQPQHEASGDGKHDQASTEAGEELDRVFGKMVV